MRSDNILCLYNWSVISMNAKILMDVELFQEKLIWTIESAEDTRLLICWKYQLYQLPIARFHITSPYWRYSAFHAFAVSSFSRLLAGPHHIVGAICSYSSDGSLPYHTVAVLISHQALHWTPYFAIFSYGYISPSIFYEWIIKFTVT